MWEGVPEAGGRAAAGSRSHGGQIGRWYSEVNGRRRSEGAGRVCRHAGVQKGMVNGLKCEEQSFKNNAVFDREPIKLLKDRRDVINGGGSGNDASSRVLD